MVEFESTGYSTVQRRKTQYSTLHYTTTLYRTSPVSFVIINASVEGKRGKKRRHNSRIEQRIQLARLYGNIQTIFVTSFHLVQQKK
mmetsp:Transcript_34321/g.82680  ORF Transcript_34321/g.82680 Transcript_34321/m.82680 type:complete len:86 (+) Transcript_34321:723-980(+)